MKGTNTLKLNQETMCEALQVWLDKTMLDSGKLRVSKVTGTDNNRTYGGGSDFEVEVQTKETVGAAGNVG